LTKILLVDLSILLPACLINTVQIMHI